GGGGLLHDGECPGQPSAGLVDQAPGGLEVEGDGEVGLVRSGGRAGRGDQFGVDLSGDGGLGLPVLGPVAGERVTAVGHGALQHLHGGDVPGAGDTCQRATPAAHVVVLGGWVEEGEGTAGDAGDGGQGLLVRVVDGCGSVGGIAGGDDFEGSGGAGQMEEAVLPGPGDRSGEPEGLAGAAAVRVPGDDRCPVDEGAAVAADGDECAGCRPQRCQGNGAE